MALLGILEGGGGVRELLLEISACHAIEFDLLASSCPGDRACDDDGQIAGERTIPGNVVVRLRAKPFKWRPGPLGHYGNDGGVQGRTACMLQNGGPAVPVGLGFDNNRGKVSVLIEPSRGWLETRSP